jgi:hypothetical protein
MIAVLSFQVQASWTHPYNVISTGTKATQLSDKSMRKQPNFCRLEVVNEAQIVDLAS